MHKLSSAQTGIHLRLTFKRPRMLSKLSTPVMAVGTGPAQRGKGRPEESEEHLHTGVPLCIARSAAKLTFNEVTALLAGCDRCLVLLCPNQMADAELELLGC